MLKELKEKVKTCNSCDLRDGCENVVFGRAIANADVIFIGEAPGEEEDEQALPFVGRSGSLLMNLIKISNLEDKSYIDNVVRCRPPDNRKPFPIEIDNCWPWLQQVLGIIQPKVIVTLGDTATSTLAAKMGFTKKIGQNKITKLAGKRIFLEDRKQFIFPVVHPAYALRNSIARRELEGHIKYLGVAIDGWLHRV